ncbi:hypothetical protein C8J57DRAFT_1524593 [Mycena rebaudengoi]|nr:hypothetical protein C8J57DRAFT_1524593 [Mycena rebaudengoi]
MSVLWSPHLRTFLVTFPHPVLHLCFSIGSLSVSAQFLRSLPPRFAPYQPCPHLYAHDHKTDATSVRCGSASCNDDKPLISTVALRLLFRLSHVLASPTLPCPVICFTTESAQLSRPLPTLAVCVAVTLRDVNADRPRRVALGRSSAAPAPTNLCLPTLAHQAQPLWPFLVTTINPVTSQSYGYLFTDYGNGCPYLRLLSSKSYSTNTVIVQAFSEVVYVTNGFPIVNRPFTEVQGWTALASPFGGASKGFPNLVMCIRGTLTGSRYRLPPPVTPNPERKAPLPRLPINPMIVNDLMPNQAEAPYTVLNSQSQSQPRSTWRLRPTLSGVFSTILWPFSNTAKSKEITCRHLFRHSVISTPLTKCLRFRQDLGMPHEKPSGLLFMGHTIFQ